MKPSALRDRVMLLVAKARAILTDDSAGLQRVQVELLKGEVRDAAARVQEYGLTSRPHSGATAIAVFLTGNRAHPVIVAMDDPRYRPRGLKEGEVVVYDDLGHEVRFKREGIEVNGGGHEIKITNAPSVRMETPLLEVTGEIRDLCDSTGKTMSGMRSVYDEHDHQENNIGNTNSPNQKMNP